MRALIFISIFSLLVGCSSKRSVSRSTDTFTKLDTSIVSSIKAKQSLERDTIIEETFVIEYVYNDSTRVWTPIKKEVKTKKIVGAKETIELQKDTTTTRLEIKEERKTYQKEKEVISFAGWMWGIGIILAIILAITFIRKFFK